MYASLLISLLAAFVAMLGKQWMNRYKRNSGGSMIERCGDRQRKFDGLEKWSLNLFIESLPVMLQASLLFLACGLCRYMWSINTSVARVLISLTSLGVGFYVAIVIAGTSSYACPFQTPASTTLRSQWKKVRRGISSIIQSKRLLPWDRRVLNRRVRPLLHQQSPPTIPLEDVEVQRYDPPLDSAPQFEPWLKRKDLDIMRRTNTNDVRCVSWILINITDPEALDTAIRLAGEIRWFGDGTNVNPPYDQIVSTFEACFDSVGNLYPGSRNRAYYSGRAIMWIHTLAACKSAECANAFPLPSIEYTAPPCDPDLEHLLHINLGWSADSRFRHLLKTYREHTPSHLHWVSKILLHLSWANRTPLDFEFILGYTSNTDKTIVPLSATLNRLLAWCILLGSPVEEEALKVQDKSYDISCSLSLSCSSHSSPVIVWKASYINYPRSLFQHSTALTLNVNSSRMCCSTWSSWKTVLIT